MYVTHPKLLSMRIFVFAALGLIALSHIRASGDEPSKAQQEAIATFPDLGKAGSPLHSKFLEIYQRAKQAKSPALSKPDWPLVLAREAAASLSQGGQAAKETIPDKASGRLVLKPTKFYIPAPMILEPPDFVAEGGDGLIVDGPKLTPQQIEEAAETAKKKAEEAEKKRVADWKAKNDHRVTLPAHVFATGEGKLQLKGEALEGEPGYVRTLRKLRSKAKTGDWEGIQALARIRAKLSEQEKEAFMKECSAMEGAEILLLLQVEGMQLAIVRTENSTMALSGPIVQPEVEYIFWNGEGASEDTRRLIADILAFLLRGGSVHGLLVK